jgi:aryl-alcohol dehydrogenase-like predicted oxidoreductase
MAESRIPTTTLGTTGIPITAIGVGGWLGELEDPEATDDQRIEAAIDAVRRAVELGVHYFDSSPAYGHMPGGAELWLGLGLQSLSSEERAGLTISTKVGTDDERPHQYDADSVRWSLERSLKRLQLDKVDIIHVHDPETDEQMDEILAPGGAFEALEGLKEEGVIRAIGLGVRNHRFLRRAIESGRIDSILPSYDYHPIRTSVLPILELAAEHGVGVANGSPYAAGLLAMDPDVAVGRRWAADEDLELARELWRWCQERGIELGALAMQYSMRCPHIDTTLVGPRTATEVEANVRHATAEIAEEVLEELEELRSKMGEPAPGGEEE